MNKIEYSSPIPLNRIRITDSFWKSEMELVRKEMIPFQWKALNDQLEEAPPSFCMHNFKVAGKRSEERKRQGKAFKEPAYTDRGFEMLPEDRKELKEEFYGYVFQDSDFYKWIEAVGYSLAQEPDPELEKVADQGIDIVCNAQQDDGYLDTYYIINGINKAFTNLRDYHELYCLGHLAEGAVAYFEATGKDKLLKAAERYADCILQNFGSEEGKRKGYPGHEIAEMALVRLYEATGKEKYLKLGSFFINERGTRPYYFDLEHPESIKAGHEEDIRYAYQQAHMPVRQQTEAVGHAVRAVYLYSGMADTARCMEDRTLYEACERLWSDIVNRKMYITGGIGGTNIGEAFSFPYDLPNDTAYAETCASVGLVFFARRMLQIRPDAQYADVMERVLYNGVLSGMALDGKSFFYVNPLEVVPEACHRDERKSHVKPVRQKWFGCACCPPNVARLLSSVGSYAYTEKEDTIFIHLYIGAILKKQINGKEMEVKIQSEFPWNGKVNVYVKGVREVCTIAFHIPEWGEAYQLSKINGATIKVKERYLYVTKKWEEEEEIHLQFPMEVRLIEANPFVRENIGKNAVMRGPLVYCLEEVDNGSSLHLLSIVKDAEVKTMYRDIAGVTMVCVELSGRKQVAKLKENTPLYYDADDKRGEQIQLQYIPYYAWANRGENEMQVWTRRET